MKNMMWIAIGLVLLAMVGFGASHYRADLPLAELEKRYANAASKYIDIDGTRVHYRDEGQGPELVLIHGTSASLHTWEGWRQELRDDFRLIRMDLPGFGLTGPNADHDYRISAYVAFVDRFLDELELDSVFLAGNSLGGHIAWRYAVAHPGRVRKLVLIDAGGYPEDSGWSVMDLGTVPVLRQILTKITPLSIIENGLLDVYADDSLVTPELVQRYLDLLLRPGNREALMVRLNTELEDRHQDIVRVDVPTLVMWGRQDPWLPVHLAERFHADLPDSQLLIYDHAGHAPMEEIPGPSATDARAFLTPETAPANA